MPALQETVDQVRRIDVDQYKYGFVTDIESDKAPKGLSEDIVRFISAKKNEPTWMLEWRLDAYRRWVDDYRDFVRTEGAGVLPVQPTQPHRVRDTAGSRIWAAYEQVRGYEPVLRWADVETLHELRIAGKWLRYTLEFVREALGDESGPLIERVTALQDHLGLMNDANVSGSMAPYADSLLRLAHTMVRGAPQVEVFTIGTRLTHLTRAMRQRDVEKALLQAGDTVPDWSGGTRLGEVLKIFLDRWGQRGMARRAVVVKSSRVSSDLARLGLPRVPHTRYSDVVWARIDLEG